MEKLFGHIVFGLLALLSLLFWQERTLLLDAAFQGYLLVATGQPAIMVERFGAVALQALPLLAVHLGAPLSVVLPCYSLSYVLFHWLSYSWVLHVWKDKRAAAGILLFVVLLSGDSFYWMQNELLPAISLIFVAWACLQRGQGSVRARAGAHACAGGLALVIIYLHPLVFFPLAFWVLFNWLEPRYGVSRKILGYSALLFALIFASKYILRTPNFYDRGMTGQFVHEFSFNLHSFFYSRAAQDLWAHCGGHFFLLLPLFAGVLLFYARQRKWAKLLLVCCFTITYIYLILHRFRDDDRWYIQESHYQALAFFLILPMVWDIWPQFSVQKWLRIVVALLLLFRVFQICQLHTIYQQRLSYVKSLVAQSRLEPGWKFVVPEQSLDRHTLMMNWGLPYESLQISALDGPDSVRVLAVGAQPDLISPDSMPGFLMIRPLAFRDLPVRYYHPPADSARYRVFRPVQ